MGGIASKWDEMNEVNDAQEEVDNEQKTRKKSLTNRLKTRILRSDPRSASEGLDRTPIAVERPCDTPVRNPKELVDPRSPGLVMSGEVVLERTPLLVMQKSEDKSTPVRGSVPPPFCLPDTPSNDSINESPVLHPAVITSTPATIPLVQKTRVGESQPANLLQERLREAAIAAMRETAEKEETAGAAGDMETGAHNDSSLII